MEKQKIIAIALWGIVAYSVALLTFWTLKVFNQNAENISAFGSLLSACATFFAAYVAIKLFNDWRDEQEHQNKLRLLNLCFTSSEAFESKINLLAHLVSRSKIQAKQIKALAPMLEKNDIKKLTNELKINMEQIFDTKIEIYEVAGELKVNLNRLFKYTKYKEIPILSGELFDVLRAKLIS